MCQQNGRVIFRLTRRYRILLRLHSHRFSRPVRYSINIFKDEFKYLIRLTVEKVANKNIMEYSFVADPVRLFPSSSPTPPTRYDPDAMMMNLKASNLQRLTLVQPFTPNNAKLY